MRTILFPLLSVLFYSTAAVAQSEFAPGPLELSRYDVLDACQLKVTYQLTIHPDPAKADYTYNDVQVLEIGEKYAKSYSYLLYQTDSLCTALRAKGVKNVPALQKAVLPMEVLLSAREKQTTVIYRTIVNGPQYIYTEPTENIQWTVGEEAKELLGYSCRKATASFRGRNYIAWFTMEIPSPYGPYKFCGLPGLILSIEDDKGEYCWSCIGIQKGSCNMSIKRYKWDYTQICREKLEPIVARMYADPMLFIQTALGVKVVNNSGKSTLKMAYNPLEK